MSATKSLAIFLRTTSTGPTGRTVRSNPVAAAADSPVGAPPASSARNSACSWFTARTRACDRLPRRSSSTPSASAVVSASNGRASPCNAATHAAAAASIRSFFRPPPRESCRTRAVAVVGTSTTCSPRASNQEAKCRPSPSAFSIAQRCSGHRPAQVSSRRYSRSVASIRIEATSRFDWGSTAAAVDVDLCGSTPISIIVIGSLHFPWNGWGDPRPTLRLREHLPVLSWSRLC